MLLVFLWDWSPVSYFSLEGEFKTRQSSCSGDVESVGGAGGGVKGNTDAERDEGWGVRKSDSVSNRQSYLPCKSAFINATFVSKNNRKGKGKVDRLLVEHWDIGDGATDRHRASRQGEEVGGQPGEGRGMSVLRKSQRGKTMEWRQNCNGSSPKWHRQYGVKNMQSLSHSNGVWPIRFVTLSQVITDRRACNGETFSAPMHSEIVMTPPSDSLSAV